VATLAWRDTADGYEAGEYHIVRTDDVAHDRWRLEIERWRPRGPVLLTSVHRTLAEARDRATREERERVGRALTVGYAVVAALAATAFALSVPLVRSPAAFVAILLAAVIALRAFASAVAFHLGDAWSWVGDRLSPDHMTRTDRAVLAVVEEVYGRVVEGRRFSVGTTTQVVPLDPVAPSSTIRRRGR
jgi:hypothetical protein